MGFKHLRTETRRFAISETEFTNHLQKIADEEDLCISNRTKGFSARAKAQGRWTGPHDHHVQIDCDWHTTDDGSIVAIFSANILDDYLKWDIKWTVVAFLGMLLGIVGAAIVFLNNAQLGIYPSAILIGLSLLLPFYFFNAVGSGLKVVQERGLNLFVRFWELPDAVQAIPDAMPAKRSSYGRDNVIAFVGAGLLLLLAPKLIPGIRDLVLVVLFFFLIPASIVIVILPGMAERLAFRVRWIGQKPLLHFIWYILLVGPTALIRSELFGPFLPVMFVMIYGIPVLMIVAQATHIRQFYRSSLSELPSRQFEIQMSESEFSRHKWYQRILLGFYAIMSIAGFITVFHLLWGVVAHFVNRGTISNETLQIAFNLVGLTGETPNPQPVNILIYQGIFILLLFFPVWLSLLIFVLQLLQRARAEICGVWATTNTLSNRDFSLLNDEDLEELFKKKRVKILRGQDLGDMQTTNPVSIERVGALGLTWQLVFPWQLWIALNRDEIRAILWHEVWHANNLRSKVFDFFSPIFFIWGSTLRKTIIDSLEAEFEADDFAAAKVSPSALVNALESVKRVVSTSSSYSEPERIYGYIRDIAGVIFFGKPEMHYYPMGVRIDRLKQKMQPPK